MDNVMATPKDVLKDVVDKIIKEALGCPAYMFSTEERGREQVRPECVNCGGVIDWGTSRPSLRTCWHIYLKKCLGDGVIDEEVDHYETQWKAGS